MKVSSLPAGIEHADDQEQVGVPRGGRDEELRRDRAGDLGLALERRHREGHARARARRTRRWPPAVSGFAAERPRRRDRGRASSTACARAATPVSWRSTNFSPGWRTLSCTRRLAVPAVVDALQEVVEEALLQRDAVAAGEKRPVRVAVRLEPLRRVVEASRVKPLKLPRGWMPCPPQLAHVRSGTVTWREVGGARAVPLVVERMLLQLLERVDAVLRQLFVGERDRARRPIRRCWGSSSPCRRGRTGC